MQTLFTPWRHAYITQQPPDSDCFFCAAARRPDDPDGLVVATTRCHLVMLNLHPYSSGHLMVAPIRHESELNGLSVEEATAMFAGLQRATRALQGVSHPDGFNVGANLGREAGAGVPGHLHFHVVPRWSGDTNFMTALAEVRVIPEDLRTTWKKLRAAWPST